MYQCSPSFVLGFHGCDKKKGKAILAGNKSQSYSNNEYDWLGSGIYFWENDSYRAKEWAEEKYRDPFVIGAVIDLRKCLNLVQRDTLLHLKFAYEQLCELKGKENLPKNKTGKKNINDTDNLLRHLDCAVIETLHAMTAQVGESPYDTVRGVFFEGNDLYPDAGFKEKSHIQICVRSRNCIKGYFLPREKDIDEYPDLKT